MSKQNGKYDVVVMGAGPAGEVALIKLMAQGKKCALIEAELVGGECAYWACIPSKTLLRAPEVQSEAKRVVGVSTPELNWQQVAEYRDYMVRNLNDAKQVKEYQDQGVKVIKGKARIAGRGTVEVDGQVLQTDRIIVATGSKALIPPIENLEQVGYWTNREATNLNEIPASVVILGGGPVGIELGQFLRRFGAQVSIVQSAPRLLPREDAELGKLVLEQLQAEGVKILLNERAIVANRDAGGMRTLQFESGNTVSGEQLIIATGRRPNIDGLGLENVQIEVGKNGIVVDEHCRATEGIWAIGDVTGVMPFTHVGMYQGRIAAADIGGQTRVADYGAVPRVVFFDPEVAAVGLTEAQARERDIDVITASIAIEEVIARPWTYEKEPKGRLTLIADRQRKVLLGAWIVNPLASEWIHYAALAIKTKTPIEVLLDSVAQFPTFSEAYLKCLEKLTFS